MCGSVCVWVTGTAVPVSCEPARILSSHRRLLSAVSLNFCLATFFPVKRADPFGRLPESGYDGIFLPRFCSTTMLPLACDNVLQVDIEEGHVLFGTVPAGIADSKFLAI